MQHGRKGVLAVSICADESASLRVDLEGDAEERQLLMWVVDRLQPRHVHAVAHGTENLGTSSRYNRKVDSHCRERSQYVC